MPIGFYDGDSTGLKGSDGTPIGNVSDRIKVDASFSTTQTVKQEELATFIFVATEVQTDNNKSMFSIVNASGSSVIVKIREIRLVNSQNNAVTGVVADLKMFRCVSHSGGNGLTAAKRDTADSLNASVTAKTGATITSEDTAILKHWKWSTDEWNGGSLDVEAADHALQVLLPAFVIQNGTKPLTLRANEGVTLKCTTNTTTGSFDIMFTVTQE